MIRPSNIHPDQALRDYLQNRVEVGLAGGGTEKVVVYGDWEKPTNDNPTDCIIVYMNGDAGGVGMDTVFARGNIMVSLYCKLNDDGTVKKNRVDLLLSQFDEMIEGVSTGGYIFAYEPTRFITPTTPNQSTGYSITTLNLKWSTTSNYNQNT